MLPLRNIIQEAFIRLFPYYTYYTLTTEEIEKMKEKSYVDRDIEANELSERDKVVVEERDTYMAYRI